MAEPPVASHPIALRLSLSCDLGDVRRISRDIRAFLTAHGCDEAELNACDLALAEGCNNAVKYCPQSTRHQSIGVECLCDERAIEIRIHDHTNGFTWPAQAALPDADSESGRGVYLMQTLMDSANYFRASGENVLVLRKQRASVHQPAEDHDRVIAAMVEELSSCYESLSAIFRYSAAQTNIRDLKQFAQNLLADLLNITGGDWFVLRLASHDESRLFPFVTSSATFDLSSLPLHGGPANLKSVELEAVTTRRAVWFDSRRPLSADDPLSAIKPEGQGLVQPIFGAEDFVGTLTVGKSSPESGQHRGGSVFTAGQANVVGTFADFLAVQVANARFHEEQVASRLVAHELDIANNIQQSLLPKQLNPLPGFQLAAFCRSAHQVGGDFYDVLRISEHEQLLVIADVMGKGVPAAMFAAILRTMLRASPELAHQPAALLTRVNRLLFEELSGVDMFITAQLAYINAKDRRLVTASAGHCPLLFTTTDGDEVKEFSPEGMPLGILYDTPFVDQAVDLPAQCRLMLYTDGLPEALNATGERFGQGRLANWFQTAVRAGGSAEELNRELVDTMAQFQANMLLNDDQTYLILAG